MNKKRVDAWIAPACQALETTGIVCDGGIDPTFRSQISSFGAAIIMGSLKSAAAFLSQQGGASIKREQLLSAIYCLISGELETVKPPQKVCEYIFANDTHALRERIIDASIALKLAMNLYDLGKEDTNAKSESSVQ